MLTSLDFKSDYFQTETTNKIATAYEAAAEQLNLLCAFISKPKTFDHALIIKYIPNYNQQIHTMRLVQQECKRLYHTEHLTPESLTTITAVELDSVRLERITEKIVFLLQYYAKASKPSQLPTPPHIAIDTRLP